MNAYLLLATLGCLCVAGGVSASKIKDLEGFFFDNRPLLGHFRRSPFIDIHELYKTYSVSFELPLYPDRNADDFRNYLPSGDKCMTFFTKFRIDKYELRDLDDFVLMDACLGYLYEATEFHERDGEHSAHVRSELPTWLADEKLHDIYHNTKIDGLKFHAKQCVSNLLYSMILVKKQNPDTMCNADFLKVFLDFAKCHHHIPEELRESDDYIHPMYELVRKRGRQCFNNEIKTLNEAVRSNYANNLFFRARSATSFTVPLYQANQRMWPKQIVELLRAVQNPSKGKQINLREVSRLIRGVGLHHSITTRRLLQNMGEYATNRIVGKEKFGASFQPDPEGHLRYNALIDNICNYFRPSDNQDFYDYTTPFARMVKMIEYPEVFGISQSYFAREVINQSYESGTLFFSVSACNLLTYTQGQFKERRSNGKDAYDVVFKPDTTDMVVWPDTGFW